MTAQPIKAQDAEVGLLPLIRLFFEERVRTYRSESTYARSVTFGLETVTSTPTQVETHVDMLLTVEAPSAFFFDQFVKSFLTRSVDMPFTLVSHSYEGA